MNRFVFLTIFIWMISNYFNSMLAFNHVSTYQKKSIYQKKNKKDDIKQWGSIVDQMVNCDDFFIVPHWWEKLQVRIENDYIKSKIVDWMVIQNLI